MDVLEEIRSKVSVKLGLYTSWRDGFKRYRTWPKIAVVAKPADFQTLKGDKVPASAIHLQCRVLSMGKPHKAFAITAAIPLAAAVGIEGSTAQQVCAPLADSTVNVGHPSGVMPLQVIANPDPKAVGPKEVVVGRTARRLMEGHVYCRISP
jgi:2-methylaconitate cis-trans-isomerase PrpF